MELMEEDGLVPPKCRKTEIPGEEINPGILE
jgi:hypothetical protein